jgi:ABC-2 type transport system permease protein
MQKVMLIMRNELKKTLRSTGYIIFAFVIPFIAILVLAVINIARQPASGDAGNTSNNASSQPAVEGYVDLSGLILTIPYDIPRYHLIPFENEEAAQQAMATGEITAYYLIPQDYIQRGEVYYVYPDDRSYLEDGQQWVMSWTLTYNLAGGNNALADIVWNPALKVEETNLASSSQPTGPAGEDCSRPGFACESNDLIRYIPSILVAIFYITFTSSSSMLFNSIGTEKENRVIEVLMLSVNPRQLLAGKTLGLCIASLLQTLAWLGAIYASFTLGKPIFNLPENFVFPMDILGWGLAFFLGGYGLYASLMAGAGALVPKMKEAGIASFIAMIPLLFGYMFGLMAPMADATQSPMIVFMSFFPLTSPVVMIMRLTDSLVPFWQLFLSLILVYATAWWALRASADIFHAQNLLSGRPFSVKYYLMAFIGRT